MAFQKILVINFPDGFSPPQKFESYKEAREQHRKQSACYNCPFYAFAWYDDWCNYLNEEGKPGKWKKCPIYWYFNKVTDGLFDKTSKDEE